jgi:hypothetical protein
MTDYSRPGEIAAELALEDVERRAPKWFRGVAFTTLVLSVLTASAALVAGLAAHETILERTEEIIDLSDVESDVLSAEILQSKHGILTALGEPLDPDEVAFVEEMEADAERLAAGGEAAEVATLSAASTHLVAAISATLFAVSIAVTGLAAVVRQRWLWFAGIGMGVIAAVPLALAVVGFFE